MVGGLWCSLYHLLNIWTIIVYSKVCSSCTPFVLSKMPLLLLCHFQSPVKNGTPSLLSSFSSSSTSGSSSSSSLVSMASVVGGITPVPTSSSLIGSFSSAVQQHQHQPAQQQQQPQPPNQPPQLQQQQQQPLQTKPSVPSNNAPSPPSIPQLPPSTSPSLPPSLLTSSTSSSSSPNSQPHITPGPSPASCLGLGLGLGLSKIGITGTNSANQIPGLGLVGLPTPLNTMAGLLSGSTPAPYAQAAASGGLGLSSITQSSISVESSTSIPTSGSSGVTTNGAGTGLGLLGTSPVHSSLSGGFLGLVPGQSVAPGASQVLPSTVSTISGVVGMMGGNLGNVGVVGGVGVNAAPAGPPSGLKQNGSTSMWTCYSWLCGTIYSSVLVNYEGCFSNRPSPAIRLQCCSSRERHRISSEYTEPITKQPTLVSQFLNQSAVSYLLSTSSQSWNLLYYFLFFNDSI